MPKENNKKVVAFSIDKDVMDNFKKIATEKAYVMSGVVEQLIKQWSRKHK